MQLCRLKNLLAGSLVFGQSHDMQCHLGVVDALAQADAFSPPRWRRKTYFDSKRMQNRQRFPYLAGFLPLFEIARNISALF
jgi:hypothetical protein